MKTALSLIGPFMLRNRDDEGAFWGLLASGKGRRGLSPKKDDDDKNPLGRGCAWILMLIIVALIIWVVWTFQIEP